ncbi:MAG: omptin family outer membrane protease [Spirochaetales bacterium]|nr:omptin family outer membrane protease [Spirochaetales bacterium]
MSKFRGARCASFALVSVMALLAPRLALAQDSPPASAALPAAEGPATSVPLLSLATGPVLVVGYMDELVYRDSTTTDLLSKLRWQLLPAAGLRLDATLSPRWRAPLSFRLSVTSLFPTVTGTMVDEDWDTGTLIYGRSEHQAQLARGMDATLFASWSWPSLGLRLGAGAVVSDFSWEGWDGSATYEHATYTDQVTFSGLVIAYRALRLGPALEASWVTTASGFEFQLGFELRYHALQWGIDSHVARNPDNDFTFFDVMNGGLGFRPGLGITGAVAPGISLRFDTELWIERFARGDDYAIQDDGSISLWEGIAGQEFTAGSFSLMVKVER